MSSRVSTSPTRARSTWGDGTSRGGGPTSGAGRRGSERLESLHLSPHAERPAGSLPHGDERRLGVARALATSPRFVLMDEPAAGLPEAEVPAFAEVVRSIRDEYEAGGLR